MRNIKLNDNIKKEILNKFIETLNNTINVDKIDFSYSLNKKEQGQINLNFKESAWLKMWSLVSNCDKEVGWHGTIERVSDTELLVTDILVYPQTVTGVTVQTDDIEYGNWLHKDISDEEINSLRLHGHSHVNMGTSPSGVDTTWYNQLLSGLSTNDFYVFMILNKREDMFIEIYDLKNNKIFDKNDIKIEVILENDTLTNWLENSKKAIKEAKVQTFIADFNRGVTKTTKYYESFLDKVNEFEATILEYSKQELDLLTYYEKNKIAKLADEVASEYGYFGIGKRKLEALPVNQKLLLAKKYIDELYMPSKKGGK